jgi:SAM-dependent methyltransferase
MAERPRLGELLLGTAGLALMRQAYDGDEAARHARVAEMRGLLDRYDGDTGLLAPLPGSERDLDSGYALWSQTYDGPMRLLTVEEPAMHGLFDSLPPGCDVLDAACGTARHGAQLAARGHRVTGVDRSGDMLAVARAKLPDAVFHQGDLEALPVADATFDAVVCGLALVHLPRLERAMAEFARVLRPGGRLIVSDVHPMPIMVGWQAQFRGADGEAAFIRLHPHLPSEYIAAAEGAGLRVAACREPALTELSVVTPASEHLPQANRAAWVGLPGVVVWAFDRG